MRKGDIMKKDDEKDEVIDRIRAMIEGSLFDSFEDAKSVIDGYMQQQQLQGIDDFQGLSAEQMHHFLYFPFDSPQFVTFAEAPPEALNAPIMRLLAMLTEAIGEKGLKCTEKGNLPRNFVRTTAKAVFGEEEYRFVTQSREMRGETDFFNLHVTRLIAQSAGIIRKYNGKFVLCRKYHTMVAKNGLAALFLPMLRANITKLYWAMYEWEESLYIIQDSFLFTLYLLHKFGGEWHASTFYEDAFLCAFPQMKNLPAAVPFGSAEMLIRTLY